jgi:D-alanyl-D-alanine carboxypeptidase/D-alanyl-D-alanine-endopeptidase (penicillin-binding protein 4)
VLRGIADVDLDWRAFEHLLQLLRLRGVREIRGDLVLDRTHFNPPRTDVGLAPFDEAPEFRYNFVPDALMLNTNLVHLDLVSDGNEVRVAMSPPLEGVSVASGFRIGERACEDWEDGWVHARGEEGARGRSRIRLQRRLSRATAPRYRGERARPRGVRRRLFRATWKRLGGTFRGRDARGRRRPGRASSPSTVAPARRVVRDVNKAPTIPITRVVYLALGGRGLPARPDRARGEREVRAWMARRGIDSEGLVLENGSGLSRTERIRPAQLAAVLRRRCVEPVVAGIHSRACRSWRGRRDAQRLRGSPPRSARASRPARCATRARWRAT